MLAYEGDLRVEYGQFYILCDEHLDVAGSTRLGQSNGLCGAAIPGLLFCTTGTHTGTVHLRVEVLPDEPELAPDHDDVVEVPFTPTTISALIREWEGVRVGSIPLPEPQYRVRYSAVGFHVARERDMPGASAPLDEVLDSYLLQFWPEAQARADAVLRVSGPAAEYWHRVASEER